MEIRVQRRPLAFDGETACILIVASPRQVASDSHTLHSRNSSDARHQLIVETCDDGVRFVPRLR